MKALALGLLLFMAGTPASAENWRTACASLGRFAHATMEARQSGTSMSAVIDAMARKQKSDFAEKVVIAAYESPRYVDKELQLKMAEEFRDRMYLECVKTAKGLH